MSLKSAGFKGSLMRTNPVPCRSYFVCFKYFLRGMRQHMMRRILGGPVAMALMAWAALFAQTGQAELVRAGDAAPITFDLSQPPKGAGVYSSIYGSAPSTMLTGDTYNLAPLAQTTTQAFFISSPGNVLQTFNSGLGKPHGANLFYAPGTGDFVVSEALTSIGPNQFLVQVQLTSVGPNGPNAWVPTGANASGAPFVAWRMDLGAFAAAADRLTPAAGIASVDSAVMTVFNAAGANIFSTAMSNNASDLTGLAGNGVVGLGGANIAGFNLASFQLAWTYTAVPEPGAGLTAGLFGICALIRRRRRA